MNDLDNMQPQNARDFYQAWYAPNNAVLVVVGDVNPEQVLALAQTNYGDLPQKVLPVRKPRLEPEQKGIRRVSFKAPAKQAYVALSWKVPGFKGFANHDKMSQEDQLASKEALSLTVLSALLDGYEGARLDRALTQGTKRVAQEVGSYYDFAGRGPQVFVLEGVPKEGVTMQILEEQLKAQIQKVARDGVSEEELKRVKAQWLASSVYKRDSLFNQAQEIGAFWARDLPLDTSDLLIDPLLQVTAQEVQAVAKKYFSDDQLTVAYLWPQAIDEQTLKRQQKAQSSGELR
jgi:zinc protease